jgi:hypothetical protein
MAQIGGVMQRKCKSLKRNSMKRKGLAKFCHTKVRKNILTEVKRHEHEKNQSKVDVNFYDVNKFLSYSDVSTLLELGKDISAANVAVRHAKTGDAFQQWQGPYKSIKNFKLMKENITKADEIVKEFIRFHTDTSVSKLSYHGLKNDLETKSLTFLQEIPLNLKK